MYAGRFMVGFKISPRAHLAVFIHTTSPVYITSLKAVLCEQFKAGSCRGGLLGLSAKGGYPFMR